jgi:lipoprotein NlpD
VSKESLPGFFCCNADLSIGGKTPCCSLHPPANSLFRAFYKIIGRSLGLTFLIVVAGCGGDKSTAPVIEQGTSLHPLTAEYRVVATGDTLYSIAWEAGRNYKELAAWNDISPPYIIQPGQKLRLVPPGANPASAKPAKTKEEVKKSFKAQKSKKPDGGTEKIKRATMDFGPWSWPAEGKILNYYGQNRGNKGLDIGGNRRQSVRAAAAGKVVYQGSGLRGYGQLIILKHNDDFLSAYAHNDNINVKEGDMVKRGQQIAEMGSSGADRVKLHFEIRRGGVPVDPLLYLPKK